jgi:hypothetical protein
MRQYLVTIGLLVAALIFYVMRLSVPALALAVLAVLLESVFWFRVLLRRWTANELS